VCTFALVNRSLSAPTPTKVPKWGSARTQHLAWELDTWGCDDDLPGRCTRVKPLRACEDGAAAISVGFCRAAQQSCVGSTFNKAGETSGASRSLHADDPDTTAEGEEDPSAPLGYTRRCVPSCGGTKKIWQNIRYHFSLREDHQSHITLLARGRSAGQKIRAIWQRTHHVMW
jgi:hypothetical protein